MQNMWKVSVPEEWEFLQSINKSNFEIISFRAARRENVITVTFE